MMSRKATPRPPFRSAFPSSFRRTVPDATGISRSGSSWDHGCREEYTEDELPSKGSGTFDPEGACLPFCEEMAPTPSRRDENVKNLFVASPCPSVLIVDDEGINIDLLSDLLEPDYEVLTAIDGYKAIDTAARRKPDLMLLDIMMPGIDGYEVCRRLKGDRRTQDIPIIFITALGEGLAMKLALQMGARDYLSKPIDPAAVLACVNNQIKLKQTQEKMRRLASLERILCESLFKGIESNSELN